MERDVMSFDVVIVGAGAAGLSAACRLKTIGTNTANRDQRLRGRKRLRSGRSYCVGRSD